MSRFSIEVKKNSFNITAAIIATFLALFLFWGYQYGTENHAIVIPFLKKFINPGLYPGDYLIAQKPFFLNYFWDFLGAIIKYTNLPITTLFFICHNITLLIFFAAFGLVSQKLFNDRRVTALAILMLLASPFNPLGGTGLFGSALANQTASLPLCLMAIYFFLEKRYITPLAITGAAFFIHPLSAFYTFIILCSGLYRERKKISTKEALAGPFLFLLIISPLLWQRLIAAPQSLHFFQADPLWLKLLHMRSGGHISILSMGAGTLIKFPILVALFLWSLKNKPAGDTHAKIISFVKTIFLLCVAAFFFTEIIPLTFIVQMQFFRSSQIFLYIALVYIANSLLYEITRPASRWRLIIIAMLIITTGWAVIKPRTFSIGNAQNKNWINAQLWARDHTAIEAMFITPPEVEGFRIESERTIYGDYKDGTQMFFNPTFGKEWLTRMQSLGFTDYPTMSAHYQQLNDNDFKRIALRVCTGNQIFVVTHSGARMLMSPVVYKNDEFIIYQLSDKAKK